MFRLITFSMLLAAVTAQSGYEYNKPGRSFDVGTTANQGYPGSSGKPSQQGYPGSSGPPSQQGYSSKPSGPPSQQVYLGSSGQSSKQGYPSSSNQPTQQGYPGSTGQQTQQGYPDSFGNQQGHPGEGPTSFSFPSQGPSGPSGKPGSSYPGQVPSAGQLGSNYQGQGTGPGQNYPGQSGGPSERPASPGQGQNYAGISGQPESNYQTGATGGSVLGSSSFFDDTGAYPGGDFSAIPGEPDKDYPIFSEIPITSFKCDAQPYPGYYADVEARCQVFHVCANKIQYNFLCPNGTIFSQEVFVCVWWNQFDCNSAPSLYEKNANLYANTTGGVGPLGGFPGLNGYTQGSGNLDYTGTPEPQRPSTGYPSTSPGSQSGYPGSLSPPGPPSGFPSGSGPQGPSSGYPGSPAPQANYPASGPNSYPGSTSQGSTGGYPTASGHQGYPGSQGQPDFSGTDNSQGYPSGKPSGNSFPSSRPQSPGGSQTPNREYLPPV